eukprot:scaffold2312_cov165-Ochromonas_danica.AAC.52
MLSSISFRLVLFSYLLCLSCLVWAGSFLHPLSLIQAQDKDLLSFSQDGKLFQVEYASKAGQLGTTILTAKVSPCEIAIVIPYHEKVHMLQENRHMDKIMQVSENCYVALSGLAGDCRLAASILRSRVITFKLQFNHSPSPFSLAKMFSQYQHEATLSRERRPLGVKLLVMGYCEESKSMEIHHVESTGNVLQYLAMIIGRHSEKLIDELERRWESPPTDRVAGLRLLNSLLTCWAEREGLHDDHGDDEDDDDDVISDAYILRRVSDRTILESVQRKDWAGEEVKATRKQD